jgi:Ribbon-helix-helix domain
MPSARLAILREKAHPVASNPVPECFRCMLTYRISLESLTDPSEKQKERGHNASSARRAMRCKPFSLESIAKALSWSRARSRLRVHLDLSRRQASFELNRTITVFGRFSEDSLKCAEGLLNLAICSLYAGRGDGGHVARHTSSALEGKLRGGKEYKSRWELSEIERNRVERRHIEAYDRKRIYVYMTIKSTSELETTRLTITWSKEADHALRSFLGSQGMKKGDISRFIEEAVRWRIFHQTVREAREAFADVSPDQLQKMIDEATEEVRAKHYRERAERS